MFLAMTSILIPIAYPDRLPSQYSRHLFKTKPSQASRLPHCSINSKMWLWVKKGTATNLGFRHPTCYLKHPIGNGKRKNRLKRSKTCGYPVVSWWFLIHPMCPLRGPDLPSWRQILWGRGTQTSKHYAAYAEYNACSKRKTYQKKTKTLRKNKKHRNQNNNTSLYNHIFPTIPGDSR